MSRCSSTSTNATLVAPATDTEQPYRTAADVERELEFLIFSRSDDEDDAAWSHSFSNQLLGGGDAVDEELEDFEFHLPDGL